MGCRWWHVAPWLLLQQAFIESSLNHSSWYQQTWDYGFIPNSDSFGGKVITSCFRLVEAASAKVCFAAGVIFLPLMLTLIDGM